MDEGNVERLVEEAREQAFEDYDRYNGHLKKIYERLKLVRGEKLPESATDTDITLIVFGLERQYKNAVEIAKRYPGFYEKRKPELDKLLEDIKGACKKVGSRRFLVK